MQLSFSSNGFWYKVHWHFTLGLIADWEWEWCKETRIIFVFHEDLVNIQKGIDIGVKNEIKK